MMTWKWMRGSRRRRLRRRSFGHHYLRALWEFAVDGDSRRRLPRWFDVVEVL